MSGFVSGFVVVVVLPIVCVLIEIDGWMDWWWLLVVGGGGWVVGGWCMWLLSWFVVAYVVCEFALVFCFDTHTPPPLHVLLFVVSRVVWHDMLMMAWCSVGWVLYLSTRR